MDGLSDQWGKNVLTRKEKKRKMEKHAGSGNNYCQKKKENMVTQDNGHTKTYGSN